MSQTTGLTVVQNREQLRLVGINHLQDECSGTNNGTSLSNKNHRNQKQRVLKK